MKNLVELTQAVDKLLPQTQCERCDYKGCKPYAEAIVRNNEALNKCVPGGEPTMQAIAQLLNRSPQPIKEQMPQPKMVAVIKESECIGCTKCIQACPVDAIVGASKALHTVIADYCTGCELCLPFCPTNCINMEALEGNHPTWIIDQTAQLTERAEKARENFNRRNLRLAKQTQKKTDERNSATTKVDIKSEIQASLLRAQKKKQTS